MKMQNQNNGLMNLESYARYEILGGSASLLQVKKISYYRNFFNYEYSTHKIKRFYSRFYSSKRLYHTFNVLIITLINDFT